MCNVTKSAINLVDKEFIIKLFHLFCSKDVKQHLIDVARTVIAKGRITNVNVFFNLYGILLNEIYDNTQQQLGSFFVQQLTSFDSIKKRCTVYDFYSQ